MTKLSEGLPVVYTPILRVPWHFPFQAGIAGYRLAAAQDKGRPICVITGKPVSNANGEAAEAEEE